MTETNIKQSSKKGTSTKGQGAFGKVFKATYKKNKRTYALKKISKKQIHDQHMISQLNNQIKISKSVQHDNIIRLYDTFEQNDQIYLVLELAQNGQVYDRLKKQGRFSQATVQAMISDVVAAVQFLHSRSPAIIHRDIKPENLLLDKNNRIKLADFGWSNFMNKPRKTYCGTLVYLAPQMIDKSGHDQKLDIWCIGVLTYELLTGRTPFVIDAKGQNAKKMLEDNIVNVRISFPNDFPTQAKSFVSGLIKRNPKQRMALAQIKAHPWLKNVNNKEKQHFFDTIKSSKAISLDIDNANNDTIIKQLTTKIKNLEKQNIELRSKTQVIKVQNHTQYEEMVNQLRKLKVTEQLSEKYQTQNAKLWQDLSSKDKQIITLKNQLKSNQSLKEELEFMSNQKNTANQKNKKLQKDLETAKSKQKELQSQLNISNQQISNKIKNGVKIQASQINTDEFINYLQEQLEIITNKFQQSQKVLNKLLQKQKIDKQKQDELVKLRLQQKNIRQEIRYQMQENYQNQIDQIILKSREELNNERDKWFKDYLQLKSIYQQNSYTGGEQSTKQTEHDGDLELQLRSVKQLNSYYEKTIKEQSNKIKDFQQLMKKKK